MVRHSRHTTNPGPDVRIRRTRTGCDSCKLRRKKCDERKPICVGCERNSLCCTWSPNPKKGIGPSRKRLKSQKQDCATKRKPCQPTESCTYSFLGTEQIAVSPVETTVIDHEFGSAARLSVLVSTTNMKVLPSSIMLRLPTSDATVSNPSSRLLLQHFIQETANTLSSHVGTSNPFITELLPIAMENIPVLHAVLALAGVHYAERVSSSLKSTTWTHYSAAIQSVRLGIAELGSNQQHSPLPLMLCTLILCFIENARGDTSGNVFYHLRAAQHLILSCFQLPSSVLATNLRGFIAEFYAYLAVLADISFEKDVQDGSCIEFPLLFANDILSHRAAGMLLGCAQGLFELIPQISRLSRRRLIEEEDFGRCSVETLNTYFHLRDHISQWNAPADGTESSHVICGLLYQQALLVYLESSIRKFELISPESTSFIENALDRFVNLLNSLPVESPISTTLSWPIVVLGSCARSTRHREIIASRLEKLSKSLGMGCIRQSQRLLEKIWSVDSLGSDSSQVQATMKLHNLQMMLA